MSAWDDGFDVRRELKRTAGNRHLAVGTVYGTTKCRAKSAAKPGGYTREKQPAHATVQPAAHLTGSSVGKLQGKKGCTRAVPMKMTRRPWLRTDVSTATRAETTCYAIRVSPFVLTVNRLLAVLLIFIANVECGRVD